MAKSQNVVVYQTSSEIAAPIALGLGAGLALFLVIVGLTKWITGKDWKDVNPVVIVIATIISSIVGFLVFDHNLVFNMPL